MAWFKCIGSIQGGGTSITKTVLLSETEYANLVTKEDDTLYEVYHDDRGSQILNRYVGSTRITRKENSDDYEFWYEDVFCNERESETVLLDISWNDFISRDWQLEFNANTYITSSESCIFGSDSDGVLEMYFYGSDHRFSIFGWGPDNSIADCMNQDMKIVYNHTNNEVNVYKNDVVVQTFTPSSKSSNLNVRLFSYKQNYNYKYGGLVKYIGFKWLD